MNKLVIGAVLAASVTLPAAAQVAVQIGPEVREYIVKEGRSSVRVDTDIAVGATLPADVEVYAIEGVPTASTYRYAVVNDRRVIVEPGSRRIIEIVD